MYRILIVDDEQDLVSYIAAELGAVGFTTSDAYNGVEAVLKVLDDKPDAVLMDIRMPKLDGLGALRIIRRIAPEVPVVMFTGQAGQGDMLESTRLGAFSCLSKPLAIEKVINTLRLAMPH
ncbi:MAG: response regulator [Chloroflexi bacterium]|nr:response regulator [Chloroflexota bacterium]